VVGFTPQPLYPGERTHGTQGGPQSRLGHCDKDKIDPSMPGIEPVSSSP